MKCFLNPMPTLRGIYIIFCPPVSKFILVCLLSYVAEALIQPSLIAFGVKCVVLGT